MLAPLVFFISLILRLLFVSFPGFKADIAYWKWWGMSAAHDGISGPLVNTAYNYPSFYLYILKFTSHLYEFLTGFNFKLNPNDATFWSDTNFLYLFLIKLPYILADLGIGILIYKIVSLSLRGRIRRLAETDEAISKNDVKRVPRSVAYGVLAHNDKLLRFVPLITACLYLFNPVVIYNSSIWGQTDSIGAFLVLLAFYFLLSSQFSLLAVFSAIALFMKVQTVIFLPVLFLGILLTPLNLSLRAKRSNLDQEEIATATSWSRNDKKKNTNLVLFIKSLWVFTATAIIINLPFLISHTMARVFEVMYSSQTYFPYVSMNAYNLWWLIFGRASSSFWDQNLISGLISFKMMGLVLFGSVYGIAIILSLRGTSETSDEAISKTKGMRLPCSPRLAGLARNDNIYLPYDINRILSAFILVSFAFFLLLTQMHERYLFPIFVFFPILLGINAVHFFVQSENRKWKIDSRFLLLSIIYILLSVSSLLNLHQVMIMNYPDNVLPFLPNTFSEPLTRVISFINIIIFIILFFFLTVSSFWGAKRPQNRFWTSQNDVKAIGIILFTVICLLFFVSLPKLWLYSKPIIYLSELSPIVANQGYGQLQINKSVGGTWLSSLYYFFDKGLGTHANSQIIFNLDKRYNSFTTNFGIDTEASEVASVIFIIKGDGKTLFTSPKMTRFSFPGFAKVSVFGVKLLELDVTAAGDGINSDHADWLEPKLYK